MPVQFGIVCGRCSRFHFISGQESVSRIRYDRDRGEFKLTCVCANTTYFRNDRLVPFVVAEEHVQRGFAEIEDCRPIPAKGEQPLNE